MKLFVVLQNMIRICVKITKAIVYQVSLTGRPIMTLSYQSNCFLACRYDIKINLVFEGQQYTVCMILWTYDLKYGSLPAPLLFICLSNLHIELHAVVMLSPYNEIGKTCMKSLACRVRFHTQGNKLSHQDSVTKAHPVSDSGAKLLEHTVWYSGRHHKYNSLRLRTKNDHAVLKWL
jgi:hypothetical protein